MERFKGGEIRITKYIITAAIALFIGVNGTIYFYEYLEDDEVKVTEETIQTVNITESDSISTAIEKVYDAVFTVESVGSNFNSLGTAFVYKTDDSYAYLLTNHHVIDGTNKINVSNHAGEKTEAVLMGSDELIDLAVLRIDKSFVSIIAELGTSTDIEIGDTVFAVGTPISVDYRGTVTKGIISGLERQVDVSTENSGSFLMEVIQTNTAINPGNSGGPLVNINGEVIGINTLKLVEEDIEGMGFAIPIEMALSVVDRLEAGEEIKRPYLGVSFVDASNDYALDYNNIVLDKIYGSGVVIVSVEKDSVAEKYGLQVKDVVLKINGKEVENGAQLKYELYKYEIGETITLEIERDGNKQEILVVLEKSV